MKTLLLLGALGVLAVQSSIAQLAPSRATETRADAGLVGWWKLDDVGCRDSSGYGNHGALTGSIVVAEGIVANALQWDASGGDVVNVGASELLTGVPFTYTIWIRPTGATTRTILAGVSGSHQQFRIVSTGQMQFVKQGSAVIASSTANAGNDVWNFIALSYSAAGDYAFYLNGTAAGSGNSVQTFVNSATLIGEIPWQPFNGRIDDLRIYNRSLSATEIKTLYADTKLKYQ